MAKDVVIRAEGLGKKYIIGHEAKREPYIALRDVLARVARNAWRKTTDMARGRAIVSGDTTEDFWALKDVNFEIRRGEVVGVIGRNGAGKSTLLKILSRITEPTEGEVTIEGRVASLLEVGTGFHPELTGRENIYLNGAILGMTRAEIRCKFDEIVSFAEVERFLDTPVKRFSSGMYVRLAFAIAAHLEPEILIIDEVLAVGDAEFQKKCLGKMKDVAAGGRTVIFVSHNMSAVTQLTSRAVLLAQGRAAFAGTSAEAVEQYVGRHNAGLAVEYDVRRAKRAWQGTGDVKIQSLRFEKALPHFEFLEPIRYVVNVKAERRVERLRVSMTVYSQSGVAVGSCFSAEDEGLDAGAERDIVVNLSSIPFAPDSYYCGISIGRGDHRTTHVDYDAVSDTLFFEVMPEQVEAGSIAKWEPAWGPLVFPDLHLGPMRSHRL
jgi:lipopolysaccharide transport system ATP-binding protein